MNDAIRVTRIIRLREVLDRIGLSRSTLYLLIAKGEFCQRICLTQRTVGWLESEVDAWIAERASRRK